MLDYNLHNDISLLQDLQSKFGRMDKSLFHMLGAAHTDKFYSWIHSPARIQHFFDTYINRLKGQEHNFRNIICYNLHIKYNWH